jgi:adenosylcobinamide-GDP ribazoletransferase
MANDEPRPASSTPDAPVPTAPAPPRPLSDFASAVGFLTLLPFGRVWPDGRPPRSVGWYPWVGWLLGGIVALPMLLVLRLLGPLDGTHSIVAGAVVVAAWAVLTRFLHWDGLADTFDGIWGGHTTGRRLEIMHDSRIGSFGAISMVLVALLQVSAASAAVASGHVWLLVAAPVIARFSAALAAWELPAARRDGLGLTAMGAPGIYDRLIAGSALLFLLAFVVFGLPSRTFVVVAGIGLIGGLLVPRLLAKPVGGMTGDLFGATVLLVETIVLLTGAMS